MTLSWQMKLRVTAVLCLGAGLIGFLAWPIARPADPFGAVLFSGLGLPGALGLIGLAVLVGALGYFLAWPYGEKIGILAVPAGLGIWAIRSGNMAGEILLHPSVAQRRALFSSLRPEVFFWLAIVAAGFAGVFLAQKVARPSEKPEQKTQPAKARFNVYLNAVAAVALSGVIAQFLVGVLAQDVNLLDRKFGLITAQPAAAQILFAVVVSFGAAGFAVKKFLNSSYVWPMIANGLVSFFAFATYMRSDVLEHGVQNWPVVFFSNVILSILPLQMVAFGCLGVAWGYWLAVRYDYWRHHEI